MRVVTSQRVALLFSFSPSNRTLQQQQQQKYPEVSTMVIFPLRHFFFFTLFHYSLRCDCLILYNCSNMAVRSIPSGDLFTVLKSVEDVSKKLSQRELVLILFSLQ
jgi:hypothetical protein